jgi:hypothetical protein
LHAFFVIIDRKYWFKYILLKGLIIK